MLWKIREFYALTSIIINKLLTFPVFGIKYMVLKKSHNNSHEVEN